MSLGVHPLRLRLQETDPTPELEYRVYRHTWEPHAFERAPNAPVSALAGRSPVFFAC